MKEITTLIKAAQREGARLVIELNETGKFRVIVNDTYNQTELDHEIDFGPYPKQSSSVSDASDAADEQWLASLASKPLGKRERGVLIQLVAHGAGVPVHWNNIKNCGFQTANQLEARGFLDVVYEGDKGGTLAVTEAGINAWEKLAKEL
ncbi:hypothetical protein [Taklimakanibacter albus]|uniref:Uncharacterized protein n=1 Tax=Taklimakanibacter albus TaxID=2800327 RepID=A0ACC5R1A3_9HYPH|nr:hypothetical protein [Aestuariivirga sp. YIM B02566]MBK1866410.1 hypothetical protein [Aestuariivirga sp. YIM B02566]